MEQVVELIPDNVGSTSICFDLVHGLVHVPTVLNTFEATSVVVNLPGLRVPLQPAPGQDGYSTRKFVAGDKVSVSLIPSAGRKRLLPTIAVPRHKSYRSLGSLRDGSVEHALCPQGTWIGQESGDRFTAFCNKWLAAITQRNFHVIPCPAESGGGTNARKAYESFASLLNAVLQTIVDLLSLELKIDYTKNYSVMPCIVSQYGETIPDVLWFGIVPPEIFVRPENVYLHSKVVVEEKEHLTASVGDLCLDSDEVEGKRTTETLFQDGAGEVLDRASQIHLSLRAAREEDLEYPVTISAFVSDGVRLQSYLILKFPDKMPNVFRSELLQLVHLNSTTVDNHSLAFKELVWAVWRSLNEHINSELPYWEPGKMCKVISCDGEELLLQVKAVLDYGNHGALLKTVFRGQPMVLKHGPSQLWRKISFELGYAAEYGFQVERELDARALLAQDPKIRIPTLMVEGKVVTDFSWFWNYGSCFLCRDVGNPLQDENAKLVCLSDEEIDIMILDIGATLQGLRSAGVSHNDVCPGNICYDTISGHFYLIDLGLSSYKDCQRKGRESGEFTFSMLENYSPCVDLEFGSDQAIVGQPLTPTSDLHSLLFVVMKLAYKMLPWSQAAADNDVQAVCKIRRETKLELSIFPQCLGRYILPRWLLESWI